MCEKRYEALLPHAGHSYSAWGLVFISTNTTSTVALMISGAKPNACSPFSPGSCGRCMMGTISQTLPQTSLPSKILLRPAQDSTTSQSHNGPSSTNRGESEPVEGTGQFKGRKHEAEPDFMSS